jgi:hypothetical protein
VQLPLALLQFSPQLLHLLAPGLLPHLTLLLQTTDQRLQPLNLLLQRQRLLPQVLVLPPQLLTHQLHLVLVVAQSRRYPPGWLLEVSVVASPLGLALVEVLLLGEDLHLLYWFTGRPLPGTAGAGGLPRLLHRTLQVALETV